MDGDSTNPTKKIVDDLTYQVVVRRSRFTRLWVLGSWKAFTTSASSMNYLSEASPMPQS